MRFDIHRVHVLVFPKRERKTAHRLRTVREGKVVSKRFGLEFLIHRMLPVLNYYAGIYRSSVSLRPALANNKS